MLGGVPALADTNCPVLISKNPNWVWILELERELEPNLITIIKWDLELGFSILPIQVWNWNHNWFFLKIELKKIETRTGINRMLPPVWSQVNKNQTETRSDFQAATFMTQNAHLGSHLCTII